MRLRFLQILMIVSILGIASFQFYWLKQTYDREKKNLILKTNVAFHETVMQLQAKNLKLEGNTVFSNDSFPGKPMKVFVGQGHPQPTHLPTSKDITSTINIVTSRIKDSMLKKTAGNKGMIISMDNSAITFSKDSVKIRTSEWSGENGRKDYIMQFLYSVDSLQDSIKIKDIESAFEAVLKDQSISIPYNIIKTDTGNMHFESRANAVTVGLARPVTYSLDRGNLFPYLLKSIATPVLFSLFLIGLTVLSFVLLYRNMKKQQRLAELKNDFISNITHELKTPIATVGVAIEALKNFNAMQNPERTKEYLDISSNELQRLNLLVDKVLKLSMFEKKDIELNREPVNIKTITEEVLASMRLLLEKKNAEITLSHSGDLNIVGDRLHLLSVIYNLVDNAFKYSPGSPQIHIELCEKDGVVQFNISDNGVGIPDEYKSKVFEKFFRVPAGNVHNIKGYGLGLSYASSVVQKHGGTIEANNSNLGGTEIKISIPKA